MTAAGSNAHKKLIGAEHKASKACVLPEDLYKKLVQTLYQLCEWGIPVEGAAEVGKIVINNYWRDWYADKGGG